MDEGAKRKFPIVLIELTQDDLQDYIAERNGTPEQYQELVDNAYQIADRTSMSFYSGFLNVLNAVCDDILDRKETQCKKT